MHVKRCIIPSDSRGTTAAFCSIMAFQDCIAEVLGNVLAEIMEDIEVADTLAWKRDCPNMLHS